MSRGRLVMGLLMGVIALATYFGSREVNPITGEKQHIGISRDQEVALGLQAAPEMAAQFGGLEPDDPRPDVRHSPWHPRSLGMRGCPG